jgi:hypothetical protein
VSDPHRLAEIKKTTQWDDLSFEQIDWLIDQAEETERLQSRLRELEGAIDTRIRTVEREPHLPYWAGVVAAYADVRKLLRDPDWARVSDPLKGVRST